MAKRLLDRINFTKKTLDQLPIEEKDVFYYDSKVIGLCLIVRSKGTKVFWLRGRLYGVQRKYRIGRFPDISVENARRIVEEYKSKLANGKNPAEEKLRLTKDITFGKMFNDFIENYAKLHKGSWKEDESAFKNHLYHWRNKKASSVTRAEIMEIHKKLGDAGHKTGANRLVERIRAVFNKAIDNGWQGKNPATKIDYYPEKSRDRIIMIDEMPRFFRALEKEHNRTVKDFVLAALFTVVRKNNVLSMKWEDIKQDSGIDIWAIERTKNGEPQVVVLPDILVEMLKARKKLVGDSKFVFPGDGKSGYFRDPKKAWARIIEAAKIKDLIIHDLRRTGATIVSDNNSNYITLKNILGHKINDVTAVYARTQLETRRNTLNSLVTKVLEYSGGLKNWW